MDIESPHFDICFACVWEFVTQFVIQKFQLVQKSNDNLRFSNYPYQKTVCMHIRWTYLTPKITYLGYVPIHFQYKKQHLPTPKENSKKLGLHLLQPIFT